MQLWTIQLARWRIAEKQNIPLIDTTAKSGIHTFAPLWSDVKAYKEGILSEVEYTDRYLELMRQSYRRTPDVWHSLIARDQVAIACYCTPGKFCHRHLLKDILDKLCTHRQISFEYRGEL